jgi:hypothetical protein
MAPAVPGGDTLNIFGQCAHRDHLCMVGFPALCSRLFDRVGLASFSPAPRINFPPSASRIRQNGGSAFWAPIGGARAVMVENNQAMPGKVPGS